MKRYLLLIALLTLFPTADRVKAVFANEINPTEVVEQEFDSEIKAYAKAISVKIANRDKNRGSGVIIGKQGSKYLVVTNYHVIRDAESLSIQTEDGISHQGKLVENPITTDDDIALVVFESNNNYQPVRLNSVNTAKEEKPIYAVGYAADTGEFTIAEGNIKRVNQQPFQEGYQIGYSSNVLEGMSGGAIFDNFGDLVGINGIGAFPILDTAYQYEDETTPTVEEIEQFRSLSWGLSIHRLLTQLNPEIITAYGLPQPETVADLGNRELTGWLGDLETKAKQITVRIDSSSGANGSGVIIAKSGNTYTVLTADHVLCEKDEDTNECLDLNYKIIAPDGAKYTLDPQTIKSEPGVDLAVLKFTSNETYQVAELADYPLKDNDTVFVAGFPQLAVNTEPQWHFSLGFGLDKEEGLLSVNIDSYASSQDSSSLLSSSSSLLEGYEIVYTSPTYGGMSGGAVLDREGRVIGIHGQAEGETILNNQSGTKSIIQLGYSLGIPVNTFMGLKERLGIEQILTVAENSPGELNPGERETFVKAILGTEISQSNASGKSWLERGNQLWRLKRFQEAERAFEKVLEFDEPELHYLAHYGKGLALKDQRKHELALVSLEDATSTNPEFAPAFEEKSLVLIVLDRSNEALRSINEAVSLKVNNANYYLTKARILKELQQNDEAIASLGRAIEITLRASFLNTRGLIYSEQGNIELALEDYNKAIEINPNYVHVNFNRGLVYHNQGNIQLALEDYNKSIKIDSNYTDAYNNIGSIYYEQGKNKLALKNFNRVIKMNPRYAGVYNNRGLVYEKLGQKELALKDYNKAIEIDPNLSESYLNRGSVYEKLEQKELALKDYNKAIEIDPNRAKFYINRGLFYKNLEQKELALEDFSKAIEVNPNEAESYYFRGYIYRELGRIELALEDYSRAIEVNPNEAKPYLDRGLYYDSLGKTKLALEDYGKAIKVNPNEAKSYYYRGNLYYYQGKIELALEDYSKAIEITPNYADAYFTRGLICNNQGKVELAIENYNRAIEINPNYAETYYNLGLLYGNQGNSALARMHLQKAQQLFIEHGKTADAQKVANVLKKLE